LKKCEIFPVLVTYFLHPSLTPHVSPRSLYIQENVWRWGAHIAPHPLLFKKSGRVEEWRGGRGAGGRGEEEGGEGRGEERREERGRGLSPALAI